VNITDFRGNTPLHSACTQNNKEVCELLLRQGSDPEAMDFGSQRPSDRTKSYPIQQMLERYIRNKKDEGESMTQKTVNWVGFGIGLGVGMGIALAKQQEVFAKQLREDDQKKKEEDERRRQEMEQRLKKGSQKAAPQIRKLLD
jgi:ankyrin repeat protein